MRTIRAIPGPAGWRLVVVARGAPADDADRALLARALARGRGILVEWFRGAGGLSEAWRLELAKAAVNEGEIALGLADDLAARCAAQPDREHAASAPAGLVSRRTVALALHAHGLRTSTSRWRATDRLVATAAAALGLVAWLATAVRARARRQALPARARLFALHGETSTRTRHLLGLVRDGDAPDAIIVLGRPRLSLAALEQRWRAEVGAALPPLLRPFDLPGTLLALPAALAELARGVGYSADVPWLPPWRERVAQAFRIVAGQASARWWRRAGIAADHVAFGHTGLGDTNPLERAMHAGGTPTTHVAHGLSEGINFVGHSSDSLWRSGADADWHAALGGYGRCRFADQPRPPAPPPGRGDLVLTNLAHPMNVAWRLWGVEPELRALATAVACTRGAGDDRGAVFWKPHPALATLPAADVETVCRRAEELGFSRLPDDCDIVAQALQSRRVFSTPSTAIPQLLAAGCLPLLIGDRSWAGHVALRDYPCVADGGDADATAFAAAWAAVRPAAKLATLHLSAE